MKSRAHRLPTGVVREGDLVETRSLRVGWVKGFSATSGWPLLTFDDEPGVSVETCPTELARHLTHGAAGQRRISL